MGLCINDDQHLGPIMLNICDPAKSTVYLTLSHECSQYELTVVIYSTVMQVTLCPLLWQHLISLSPFYMHHFYVTVNSL
jgi:hypothetical protein